MSAPSPLRRAIAWKASYPLGVVRFMSRPGHRFLHRAVRNQKAEQSEAGQALVEFALTACIVFGFVFCLIELCLAFYTHCLISETAREGTRYAVVRGATCLTSSQASCTATASTINTYASTLSWPNLGGGTLNVATTFPDGNQNPGSRVQVQVTYVLPITLVFVPKNSITMSSKSEMYILQ